MFPKRILLIDDNLSILDAYRNILNNEGFHADTAENGEAGLKKLKDHHYQIIITDVRFPNSRIDGFRIIEEAKGLNDECEVIVITGYSDIDLAIRAMHLDASDFLPKPCRKKELMLAIKRAENKLEMKRLVREYTETLKHMVNKKDQEIANIEEKLIHTARLSAMGEMAASICHELRQPLCGLMGFTYLLSESVSENSKAREYLKRIEEQISQMEYIVNNMRLFSRKSNGGFIPLTINDVVRSATLIFSHQFKSHGIELKEELGPDLPLVSGNTVKLQQVIINLISNARDALIEANDKRPKRILIRTSLNQTNQRIKISVSDNGIGIEKNLHEKIFQSFFTTKDKEHGTGLGLSVCKSIISDHNGEIRFRSQKGRGTTFIIALPVINLIGTKGIIEDRSKLFQGDEEGLKEFL